MVGGFVSVSVDQTGAVAFFEHVNGPSRINIGMNRMGIPIVRLTLISQMPCDVFALSQGLGQEVFLPVVRSNHAPETLVIDIVNAGFVTVCQ